ncbi:brg1-associated factor b [Kwoniella heveanensis CBS 569]|uniref:Brg1-associated factor b n=1 Tax=Kwoniella heveanensis BCC8398 TaxID=1296120 RepID=A0A1B9GZG3_9TREE|nr:brg1-associated factor b [Kwoniella heveanensis BCC8398]OCF44181.1 brg1-associated factor b [Kwoniella heveanensis CBS 569]
MVYNGDEVSALVVDFGSYTTRAGYAGEDCPRVICPSFYGYTDSPTNADANANVNSNGEPSNTTNGNGNGDVDMEGDGSEQKIEGAAEATVNGGDADARTKAGSGRRYFVGDDGVGVWRPGMEVGNFMLDGVVNDPEPAGTLLHHILHNRLSVDPTEHPLMLTEPAWNTPKAREMLTEMVFEGEKMPALYFGSAGVLSAFAAGKPTALVLDVGYANSSAVPIVDGYALRAGTKRQPLGSSLLVSQLHHHFTHPTPKRSFPLSLLPRQLIAKRDPTPDPGLQPKPLLRDDRAPHTTASWKLWAENNVVENWKEACSEVVNYKGFDFQTAQDLPQALYEFPDGYQQYFGEERYRFTEMLFDPKNYFNQSIEPPATLRATTTTDHSHSLKDLVSLSQLVHDSIMACDVDVRGALLQNIVVVGNTSLTRGLTERLDVELAALMPSQKIKIHSPTIPFERKYASWVGGSVLASLGTFHQLWVTKDEYEEHGMNIVHQREC